jgi:hypothetical protein
MAAMTEFPMFADGDVLIVAPHNAQWKLHSYVLKRASAAFTELLDSTETFDQLPVDGVAIKWHFNMEIQDEDQCTVEFRPFVSHMPEAINALFNPSLGSSL